MNYQICQFFYELDAHEEAETTEKIKTTKKTGFLKGIDLITLRERIRKHGVMK